MIFKVVCLNPESGFIFAYSALKGLCGWFLESGTHFRVPCCGSDKSNESAVFLSFVNPRELVLVRGTEIVVFDVTKIYPHLIADPIDSTGDHHCVVRRVSLPCRCICMDTQHSKLIIAGEDGTIYTVDLNGRVLSATRLPDEARIEALQVIHGDHYLVATSSELLLVNPTSPGMVQSSYKLPNGTKVKHLTVDSRRNWFSMVIASSQLGSRVVVGSTKSLASVFESQSSQDTDPLYISQTNFAETSSNGLSLVASGPTAQLLLLPLDLSSAIPRLQFNPSEDLSAVLTSQSSPKGDLIAMAGVGPSVLLVSAHSLNIVRRFSLV